MTPPQVRFHDFELDRDRFELRRAGRRIRLERKPMELLILLTERQGQLVAREEIIARVWAKDFFFDAERGINNAVRKIRAALNDNPERPRFVETVVGKGYRFVGPIQLLTKPDALQPVEKEPSATQVESRLPASAQTWLPHSRAAITLAALLAVSLLAALGVMTLRLQRSRAAGALPVRSIAVLPLTNLSADPAQEYFSDGMTDALITDLAQMGSAKVISRTSVMRYKKTAKPLPEIARELNVDGIVEGTVQRSGDRVRISAQLIQGASDKHLWANSYERDLRDVLGLQDEVAREITGEIRVKLRPQDHIPPRAGRALNPQAYDTYLRGLVYSRNEGVESKRTSLEYFNRAIQIDPLWAEPYAQLARSFDWIAGTGGHPEFYPQAKAAALNAIRLDDSLAEAHVALAYTLFSYDWDWSGAEREFHRALELNPNYSEAHHTYSQLLMAAGRNNEAVAEILRAEELDPLLPALRADVGMVYSCVGRHQDAIEQLKNVTEVNPDYDYGYSALGIAYVRKAMYPEAITNLEKALAMDKDDPDVILDVVDLAYAYAAAGRKNEARKMLATLERQEANGKNLGSQGLYPIYFALGENDRALAWMENAYREKSQSLLYVRCWPEFDHMRADPRFADLVRRAGIPE